MLLLTRYALPGWLVDPAGAIAAALGLSLVALFLLAWKGQKILGGLERLGQDFPIPWLRWVLGQVRFGLQSLEILYTPTRLLGPLFWSGVIWVLGFLTNYFVFRSAGLALSVWPAIFLLVVLQAGVAVPSSPGRIGVFHYLTVISLAVFLVPKEISLVCGIILHLVVVVPLTIGGLLVSVAGTDQLPGTVREGEFTSAGRENRENEANLGHYPCQEWSGGAERLPAGRSLLSRNSRGSSRLSSWTMARRTLPPKLPGNAALASSPSPPPVRLRLETRVRRPHAGTFWRLPTRTARQIPAG